MINFSFSIGVKSMNCEVEGLKELLTEALSTAKKRPDGVYYDYTLYFPVLKSKLPIEDPLYYWNDAVYIADLISKVARENFGCETFGVNPVDLDEGIYALYMHMKCGDGDMYDLLFDLEYHEDKATWYITAMDMQRL